MYLSSKGQVVIPAGVRRRLRLKTGQGLMVRAQANREVVFAPIEDDRQNLDEMLERARAWVDRSGRDLVEEFHERRRGEREREERNRAARSH